MKVSLILLILSAFTLVSASVLPQNARVSIDARNIKIKEVLYEIKKQTNYSFLYSNKELNDNNRVTVKVDNETIDKVLDIILQGQSLSYDVNDDMIVIYKTGRQKNAPTGDAKSPLFVNQQKITVNGLVLDLTQGDPIVGANITEKGTKNITISDINGRFSLDVSSPDAILQVSYMGYQTEEMTVGNRRMFEIALQEDIKALSEVVVVGYGTQKRQNITGAVSSVNFAKEAQSRPVTSTPLALVGLAPGLGIQQLSAQPGIESMTIRIRGNGTLNNNSPLVIVDGFEATITNVNADDIESVSILKDAASCAIYGNRGANGVILITTKSGKSGHSSISYSSIFAVNKPQHTIDVISNYADYMEIMNESAENIDIALPFSQSMIDLWREKAKDPNGIAESGYPNYVAYPNVDWMDCIFENNLYQKHNLSAEGQTGNAKYLISASYMDNPGIMMKSGFDKISLRANISSKINHWLEVGARIWEYRSTRELQDLSGAFSYMSRAHPGIYPYYDGKYGSWQENPEQSANSRNNLYFVDRSDGQDKIHYTNSAVFVNVKLPYALKYNVSFNYIHQDEDYKYYTRTLNTFSFRTGEWSYLYQDLSKLLIRGQYPSTSHWTFQNTLSWNANFAKHEISTLAGFESMYHNTSSANVEKNSFLNDLLTELSTATNMVSITGTQTDYATASLFGRAQYAYDRRYLFEVNLRYDGSSRFARKTRWGLFPSVSAGWRISQEAFMNNSGIDNLKLRASYGKLGNHSIGNYDYQATYVTGSYYSFGGKQVSGITSSLSNDLLEWETTTSTDMGLEIGILNNRLTFEADYYHKLTDGILYRAPIFATVGVKSAPYQNICEVTNNGVELTVGWRDKINDLNYGVSVNFSRNYNQVTKYNGPLKAGWVTDENGFRSYQTNIGDVSTKVDNMRRTMEGKIINEFYLAEPYRGDGTYFFGDGSVNPSGGPRDGMIRTEADMQWLEAMVAQGNTFLPNKTIGKKGIWYGDFIYADINGDGVYGDENDYRFQNVSVTPKFYYGLQFDMSWKGLDFSMLWAGAGGFSQYWRFAGFNAYSTRADLTLPKGIAYDHYFYDPNNPGDPRTNLTSEHGRLTMNYGSEQNGGTNYTTLWLYKADYLKLKNLTVGYTIPGKWLRKVGMQDARVFVSGDNLLTKTDYPGMDPEMSGTDLQFYANLKQYSIGLSVKF
ncbi:MAG: TonB-dependent receptor [Dysgonamonadaceae bacterium]|nr:TonB-dependent receptor [Dysgonamonadaceae bacterium]